jgi:hypothetical protein
VPFACVVMMSEVSAMPLKVLLKMLHASCGISRKGSAGSCTRDACFEDSEFARRNDLAK